MRKNFLQLSLILMIALPNLFACASSIIETPETPDIGISSDKFNTHFKIIAPDAWNTFKIGDGIGLSVEVIGEDSIAFKSNYGAILFILQNGQWIEVPNLMKYPEGYEMLVPAKGDALKTGGTDVDPILSNIDGTVLLRIILMGNIVKEGQITDERVAGYIDVQLKP